MVTVEIKTVRLSDIKLNPENPRTITKKAMDYLAKSLKEFPDMMKMREIVVDETMMVLGGNMRVLALRSAGVAETTAKIVKGLSLEQKREFMIKDNSAFGEWNMDILANSWSDLPLVEWGVDLPEDWLKHEEAKDAEAQIDRAEELNKKWEVKIGDLWQIGEHRLLCGNSLYLETVQLLLQGERVDLAMGLIIRKRIPS